MAPAKILEVCRVAPPETATEMTLPLTFFDIFWLRFPSIERLFFYEAPHPESFFLDCILPKLKHSLSLTLQHFLPLAGKLTWPLCYPIPIVHYKEGDGVSVTVASSNADFHHLSSRNIPDAGESYPLVAHLPVSDTQVPAIALQVTLFPNSGFCIGITSHHAVLDGKSLTTFIKSWASISKTGENLAPELTPFYEKTVLNDHSELATAYANQWLNLDGPNNRSLTLWKFQPTPNTVRATFELSHSNVKKLKELVHARLVDKGRDKDEQSQHLHITTFTVTCAYVWVCLVKAKQLTQKTVRFVFVVDCGSRLEPPLPPTYFGNCVRSRVATAELEDLVGEDGLVMAVDAISKPIRGLRDGVLKDAEKWLSGMFNAKSSIQSNVQGERVISVAGSSRFELYNTDFGWGRPRKVDMTSIDVTKAICVSDMRDSPGGVEIGLVLMKHEMETFASLFANGLATEIDAIAQD